MCSEAAKWDERYRQAKVGVAWEPTSLLKEWLRLLPNGRALDVACGSGRNAIYLARNDFEVTGIDWSEAALEIVAQRAGEVNVPVIRTDAPLTTRNKPGGIELILSDLERMELPERAFGVIVCVQYLQRTLFAQMTRALQCGGVLLFETYTRAQMKFAGGPRNPAYLLEPGELRGAFPELRVLFYRELDAGQGIASLVAQKVS
ncbi:MAG TPA: class I SAM-dependent methyltransferase [Candidatus Acidoferrum sp.]|nr:class I SAM-dependent methyltransferase [Candidatus Acidoferrum sp.]